MSKRNCDKCVNYTEADPKTKPEEPQILYCCDHCGKLHKDIEDLRFVPEGEKKYDYYQCNCFNDRFFLHKGKEPIRHRATPTSCKGCNYIKDGCNQEHDWSKGVCDEYQWDGKDNPCYTCIYDLAGISGVKECEGCFENNYKNWQGKPKEAEKTPKSCKNCNKSSNCVMSGVECNVLELIDGVYTRTFKRWELKEAEKTCDNCHEYDTECFFVKSKNYPEERYLCSLCTEKVWEGLTDTIYSIRTINRGHPRKEREGRETEEELRCIKLKCPHFELPKENETHITGKCLLIAKGEKCIYPEQEPSPEADYSVDNYRPEYHDPPIKKQKPNPVKPNPSISGAYSEDFSGSVFPKTGIYAKKEPSPEAPINSLRYLLKDEPIEPLEIPLQYYNHGTKRVREAEVALTDKLVKEFLQDLKDTKKHDGMSMYWKVSRVIEKWEQRLGEA